MPNTLSSMARLPAEWPPKPSAAGVGSSPCHSLADGVRRAEGRPGPAGEGTGARERAAEAGGGGAHARQADPERGCRGKVLGPERRRACVRHVQAALGVSERRACRTLGQPRSTQRRTRSVRDDEAALTEAIVALAAEYGRYGYRRITAMLRTRGWHVNAKRVQRIWRREGLKVPRRQP